MIEKGTRLITFANIHPESSQEEELLTRGKCFSLRGRVGRMERFIWPTLCSSKDQKMALWDSGT